MAQARDLIGVQLSVIASRNKEAVGQAGTVIDETRNMLVVRTHSGRTLRLEKRQHTFAIDGEPVQGSSLLGRPEERIKRWIKGKA